MTDLLLTMSRVSRAYRAGTSGCSASVSALRGLSLTVCRGDLVLVAGDHGAGKTTLLLCAAGMLRPDTGTVAWPVLGGGEGSSPPGVRYVAERQPAHGFLTVRESIAYAAAVRELNVPGSSRSANDILELVALSDRADVRIALLGEPERSCLLVSLALVAAPSLLLVDDLAGGTSAEGRAVFARMLERVAASGVGVVWACVPDEFTARMLHTNARYVLRDGRLRDMTYVLPRPRKPAIQVFRTAVETHPDGPVAER